MKIDIARQPLVPAFMTLFALAVAAMCAGIPVSDTSGAVRDALPLLGGQFARFQAAYPVWSKFAAGFMLLFTGMCAGRITIRYNLYTVGTCLPIPLYAIVACGIAQAGIISQDSQRRCCSHWQRKITAAPSATGTGSTPSSGPHSIWD